MRTLREMADRSDRREGKPVTSLGVRTRPTDWLLTRGFLFGQEIPGSTRAQPLQLQAGDTTAVLTLCHERRNTHRNRGARGEPENHSRAQTQPRLVEHCETTLWFAPGRVFSGGVAILPLPQNHHLRTIQERGLWKLPDLTGLWTRFEESHAGDEPQKPLGKPSASHRSLDALRS